MNKLNNIITLEGLNEFYKKNRKSVVKEKGYIEMTRDQIKQYCIIVSKLIDNEEHDCPDSHDDNTFTYRGVPIKII